MSRLPSLPPSSSLQGELAGWLKSQAVELGFHRAGITTPAPAEEAVKAYRRWLEAGLHGSMAYMEAPGAIARRADPTRTLPEIRSILVVTHRYPHRDPAGVPDDPSRGVVARYARGDDYHDVIRPRLEELHRRLEAHVGRPVPARAYADTGPILERELGQRAGLGWTGKNTMLLHPAAGSWELMGVLLLSLELPPDPPFRRDHCGSCARCIAGCPTGALLGRDASGAPVLDARRCISYLTIELKGAIPAELRPLVGNRVFGCDICQEVCPWNGDRAAARWPAAEPAYAPRPELDGPHLLDWMERILPMSGKEYLRAHAGSPLARPRRQGMLRNLCVATGNWLGAGDPEGRHHERRAVTVLSRALEDAHPLVRGHAAWALGRIGTTGTRTALTERLQREADPTVIEEINTALATRGPGDPA
jgi:epoxyqueuosine reductase